MTCPECGPRLQEWLDGRTPGAAAVSGGPPALCPACSDWAAAAGRLDHGLRLLNPPSPPPRLADRVVARVAAEHRFRRYRLLVAVGAAATAATLALAVWPGLHGGHPPTKQAPGPVAVVPAPDPVSAEPAPATLRDSVAEAGSAVASLTARTADETVAKTKVLLPIVEPSLSKLDLQPALDPPARSLRDAGQGVSAGLEPVADSARRAVGLFLRELPPVDTHSPTGF